MGKDARTLAEARVQCRERHGVTFSCQLFFISDWILASFTWGKGHAPVAFAGLKIHYRVSFLDAF